MTADSHVIVNITVIVITHNTSMQLFMISDSKVNQISMREESEGQQQRLL